MVGESGSGKSMLANAVVRLLPPTVTMSGAVELRGRDIARLPETAMRAIRGAEIGMVFQEPMAALNPIQLSAGRLVKSFVFTPAFRRASGEMQYWRLCRKYACATRCVRAVPTRINSLVANDNAR